MGSLQKKMPYYREKGLAHRGKGGQNTDIAFIALRLEVILYLLVFLSAIFKLEAEDLGHRGSHKSFFLLNLGCFP